VHLLGRYDVWDLEADNNIMPFQWGMRARKPDTLPESTLWKELFAGDSRLGEIISTGKAILKHIEGENAGHCLAFAFETEFENLRAIVLNKIGANSKTFETVWDESKYDCMIAFSWKKRQWTVSLYGTKEIDLSAIAKKYGGGGHKQACGFQCKELPFQLK